MYFHLYLHSSDLHHWSEAVEYLLAQGPILLVLRDQINVDRV